MKKLFKKYTLGQLTLAYLTDDDNRVELCLFPSELEDEVAWDKDGAIDSLVQLAVDGDASGTGFAAGHTWRNCGTTHDLHFVDQTYEKAGSIHTIRTTLQCRNILKAAHVLQWKEGDAGIRVHTEVQNCGEETITLNMLSSFSFGMITPFEKGPAYEHLKYYRLRSKWSAEGNVESGLMEDLQLIPSWAGHGVAVEKYGQVGSLPVRRFFPFAAIEDTRKRVFWAVQLGIGSTWQIEMYRKDDNLALSGGIGDFEMGHWQKELQPGECFVTPTACAIAARAPFDEVCQKLSHMQEESALFRGDERKLPLVFNEYCTTWGKPSHENITEILKHIRGKGFEYFVIDAGWYADEALAWENNMGDWQISGELFPDGLQKTVELIRKEGMLPGIWFELEVVGKTSKALAQTDHLLKRNGKVIRSGDRFFWDMRDPWTRAYLKERVINFLKRYGFQYVKIDYNESIGIGCDGQESLGQGLYDNILATKAFYDEIHREIPGICIELCSSGGHRLEPSFLNLTDMASFSDAHEEKEIPAIAANLHRVMRPEKSQIWSVIRKTDDLQRICYSVVSACLGVLCISGDLLELDEDQWKVIDDGIRFYQLIDAIQKDGMTYYYGTEQKSYRNLKGWQGILRVGESGEAYLMVHSFEAGQKIRIELPAEYSITSVYQAANHDYKIQGNVFEITLEHAFEAAAFYLK